MNVQASPGEFYFGKLFDPKTGEATDPVFYKSKDLTTHAVCVGMTGSGKTGLGIAILEEAALNSIPSIVIDPKGDLGNILLTFPNLSPEEFKPWIDLGEAERKGMTADAYAAETAKTWRKGLEAWGEAPDRILKLKQSVDMEIYTPASRAGIPLSILSSFQAPAKEISLDPDSMRERILSTTSSILGLLGIAADPIKSREHILISTIINQSWQEGKDLDLASLIQQVQQPRFEKIGALDLDTFFPPKDRMALSINLNNLLASPGFQAWMEGVPLDIQQLLYTPEQKPKIAVISIAHLSDAERMFFVTLFLNQLIAWMRKQPGTSSLRALFYMDEIFGYFPPTAMPPSKIPMITLLKQARAFGLGAMLCTQNPVDLDYKGLSNCGTWFIGRLQTARDKIRVMEGLAAASNGDMNSKTMDKLINETGNRVFIMRSIYQKDPILFQTRWALSYLRGPLTLAQIEILAKSSKKELKEVSLPISQEPKSSQNGIKPAIPPAFPEFFLNVSKDTSSVRYRPCIAGFAKLHFVDKKNNIDSWTESCLVVEPDPGKKTPAWEEAESDPDLKQKLAKAPAANASYQEVPAGILQEKNYSAFEKSLAAFLYQNSSLKILEYKDLKLTSGVQEKESDFRQKVWLALKERREELMRKKQDEYAKKISGIKEKIRKAETKKLTQEQQSLYQKFEAFLSALTTLVGAVFGKKVTKSTINQAGTTFRRIGRIGKESKEATAAEENLQELQQQLQDAQSELENEIAAIPGNEGPEALQLEEVIIRPRKTDISIDQIAVVWRG